MNINEEIKQIRETLAKLETQVAADEKLQDVQETEEVIFMAEDGPEDDELLEGGMYWLTVLGKSHLPSRLITIKFIGEKLVVFETDQGLEAAEYMDRMVFNYAVLEEVPVQEETESTCTCNSDEAWQYAEDITHLMKIFNISEEAAHKMWCKV